MISGALTIGMLISHTALPSAGCTGSRIAKNRRALSKIAAKPRISEKEDLSPLELLRKENELLRETINSADKDIEELEAQLQVRLKLQKRTQERCHCLHKVCFG